MGQEQRRLKLLREAEEAPEDWLYWFRPSIAYDVSGDRTRARKEMRNGSSSSIAERSEGPVRVCRLVAIATHRHTQTKHPVARLPAEIENIGSKSIESVCSGVAKVGQ